MPDMTASKAVNMLLEEEKKEERPKLPEEQAEAKTFVAVGNGRKACKTCGRTHGPVYYTERPDLTPE